MKKIKENNNTLTLGSNQLNVENWNVYHPNGKHMFTCGENRANWYLKRNLAIIFDKNKIKLTFTPKGYGFSDNEMFGRTNREIKCVVSGKTEELQRHHIVPYCFRKHFPDKFKSKNHHDVVLINREIHNEYEKHADEFKNKIINDFKLKTIKTFNNEYTKKLKEETKDSFIILNNIQSILKRNVNMPNNLKINKLKLISNKIGIGFDFLVKLNYIQFLKLYLLIKKYHTEKIKNFKKRNKNKYDYGFHVINKLKTDSDIMNFIKKWRIHFLETMKPKYMPKGWSVDFRIKTK